MPPTTLSPPDSPSRGPVASLRQESLAQVLLKEMLASGLIPAEDWEALPASSWEELANCGDVEKLLASLVENRLLTDYQAARVKAGKSFGLILGNYRVLGRLGSGGMGVVFKAEHLRLRQKVAIKVLPMSPDHDSRILLRFYTEMRSAAQLRHTNIVTAIDAGETSNEDPDAPVLHYFVMEYVAGRDVEEHVATLGPLAIPKACDLAYQVASALAEANKHNLVHRDIKPSNVLMTPEGQAKLLDFGLARHFRNRMTEPGTVLGTIDFMAPEQARDSSTVDIRADIYGLGGTLFWCLAGRLPFQSQGTLMQDLAFRLSQPPPSVRTWRSEVSPSLDAIIARMMALDPNDRYATPQAVMRALLPFIKPESRERIVLPGTSDSKLNLLGIQPVTKVPQVLIVDDEADIRGLCRLALQAEGVACDVACHGLEALQACNGKRYDLVLLDIDMPEMNGLEVLQNLRKAPPGPHLKIIMFSGRASADEMAQMMLAGADDYLSKPFSIVQLQARIKSSLRLKEAQDRSDLLNRHLLVVNSELERTLTTRDSDLVHARNALVLALAKLVEHRDTETGAHLMRLQRYCRILAEEAAGLPLFADQVDASFIQMLECCAPLHDIGKVGLPDHILLKPGKLDPDERIIMQSHTIIGADTLQQVAKQHNFAVAFLQMAIDIARHHHERYDGGGYPDRLAGTDIPLSARLVTLGDVYDALRARRIYKPALSHNATVQIMTEGSQGQFDPALLDVFLRCAAELERVFRELTD